MNLMNRFRFCQVKHIRPPLTNFLITFAIKQFDYIKGGNNSYVNVMRSYIQLYAAFRTAEASTRHKKTTFEGFLLNASWLSSNLSNASLVF
jgi:hypothetical protein